MTHAEQLREFIEPMLGSSFEWQFGRWQDAAAPTGRFAVLRPAGGAGAQLVRTPQFILQLIGQRNEVQIIAEYANDIVDLCRGDSGDLVYVEASEPQYVPTADGRPIFEIALAVIAN